MCNPNASTNLINTPVRRTVQYRRTVPTILSYHTSYHMSKLDAFLAKLAAKKREMERQQRRDNGEPSSSESESDSDDDDDDETDAGGGNHDASASIYGSKAYWDKRYGEGCTIGGTTAKGEVSNEWYVGYDAVKDLLLRYTKRDQSVVLLGCGTSTLGEDMAVDGFARVAAVDYSEPCIEAMKKVQQTRLAAAAAAAAAAEKKQEGVGKNGKDDESAAIQNASSSSSSSSPPSGIELATTKTTTTATACEVDYRVMDVTAMTYDDDSLDCVLDKATLDTMCQLDDDPTAGEETHANKMLRESCRVLKPGGHYVCLTYGDPESRLGMLTAEGLEWEDDDGDDDGGEEKREGGGGGGGGRPGPVGQHEIRKNKAVFWMYVMRKREKEKK